jgi:hypothetical protein
VVFQYNVLLLPDVTVLWPKPTMVTLGAATTWKLLLPEAEEPAAL